MSASGRARGPSRTRPPRAVVRAAVRDACADLEIGARVLVALSGGPDSLALCSAAVRIAGAAALEVGAVVVDHGLQSGSAQVARQAAEQAAILGCQHVQVMAVNVVSRPGADGPEAAAREARYRALDAAAADWRAAAVLLGHTREDQAETVLMRLARGAGTRSLAAMAPVSGHYRRPLLDLPRAVVWAAAAADSAADPRLIPWQDPHNSDPRFLRVRVRNELLPAVREILGPGAVLGLARTASLARADADALDAIAELIHEELRCMLDPATRAGGALALAVREQPPALRTRIIRAHLCAAGVPSADLTWEHVQEVDRLVVGAGGGRGPSLSTRVALPGGLTARRGSGALLVEAAGSPRGPDGPTPE